MMHVPIQWEGLVKRLSFAVLLVFALFAVTAMAADFKGTISDAKCGKAHADASEKSQACVAKCVNGGGAPVLVTEDKVLKIHNPEKVKEHLGHKVTVSGKLDGETLHVDKVTMQATK